MPASSGGKHRKPGRTGRRKRSIHPPRRPLGGAMALGVVAAGVLGAAPAGAQPPAPVRHDAVTLVDSTAPLPDAAAAGLIGTTSPTPGFDTSLKALLDLIGVGAKTPAQLFSPNLTVGQLLGDASTSTTTVDTSLHISDTLNLLGLQNIDISQVMNALNLPATDTVDQALSQMQFLDTKLDTILTPLGLPSTQTLLGLEDKFSVANITIDQLLPILGFQGGETLSTAWNFWAIPSSLQSLIGLGMSLACFGASNSSTIDEIIQCIHYPGGTLNGSQTLGYVLQHDPMADGRPLSSYTLGEALDFNSSTTLRQFLDNLHVNLSGAVVGPDGTIPSLASLPTLGGITLGQLMTWAGMSPSESLATLIDNLQVNSLPLGGYTIGDALDGLIVDPAALSTATVQDSTPVVDLLNAMGWGAYTIDEMLNLS